MQTIHGITDQNKFEAIKTSLETHGWQGAPLVKIGDDLITGVHRYNAAKALDMTDSEIPTIELEEVFAEAGLDFADLHAEYGEPTITDADFEYLLNELPEEIKIKYGIDWN